MPRKPDKGKPVLKKLAKHGKLTLPVEKSPYSEQDKVDKVVGAVERTGKVPPRGELEKDFPGVAFNDGAMHQLSLTVLFKLRIRGHSFETIAKAFGKSVSQVKRMSAEIRDELEHSAENLSMTEQVGRSIATFRELQGIALREAGKANIKSIDVLRSVQVAMQCENSVLHALAVAGVFKREDLSKRRGNGGDKPNELAMLHTAMARVVAGDDTEAPLDAQFKTHQEGDFPTLRI